MRVVARLDWDALGWGTPLARALGRGDLDAVSLETQAAALRRPDAPAAALADFTSAAPAGLASAWKPLQEPGARAVVTGQQPGCAGGALLAVYKAATAVALARRLGHRNGAPVVPVYWNATDDEDFDEIASVAFPAPDGSLVYLSLPRGDRKAAGWVGDLPASGDAAAVAAALALLAPDRAARLAAYVPESAADHGAWVAALLHRVFPELALLDARLPSLRVHAAPLFARYIERRDEVVVAVQRDSARLAAAGFAATLDAKAAGAALFRTRDRRREKLRQDTEPLRRTLEENPADVSPNVVLRPLVQDMLLPTIAQIVGPSEIGYLLELRGVRRLLEVPEPALVPRTTATLLEPESWNVAETLGVAPLGLVADPEAALRAVVAAGGAGVSSATSNDAFARLQAALDALPLEAAVRARAARRLEALRSELDHELDAAARATLRARHPERSQIVALARPRGRAQERVVAILWVLAAWGEAAGERLVQLADAHLDALAARHPEHALVVL